MKPGKYFGIQTHGLCYTAIILTLILLGFRSAEAQQNLARQAYTIFQQNCLNCHGPNGSFTEQLIIESAQGLIATGTVIPGNPDASEFYKRLLGPTENGAQMPFAQPPLPPAAIETIRQWIAEGVQDWEVQHDITFITTDEMLTTIQAHLATLKPFDRPFARYFTLTHLYNAGKSLEELEAYQLALSKLVNSLSWGFEIRNPVPIDIAETIFYIDLRHYEWDRNEAWTQLEQIYPYNIVFNEETQADLLEKLTNLQAEMKCEVPFMHIDWFLGTASLPPLYHDILDLPETDSELEKDLDVNVARNIESAPGVHVRRAGFKESGVSNNNRVVERHTSRYGAYWKSYDFAGNTGTQDILTHPLSFTHDGGEVVFNLPNGLQAYYVSDASGNRINEAPITIVRNLAASDPTVRNGLSCIGCHTEGMKTFEDEVRAVFEKQPDSVTKAQVLRLYVEKSEMDTYVEADTQRYKAALEKTGGEFDGIEPVSRFYEVFHGPLDAPHAAAAVGLETETFLNEIREKPSLQNLGLGGLPEGGNVKRDTWTEQFSAIISALNSEDAPRLDTSTETPDRRTPTVYIPDVNLRAAIEGALGKTPGSVITSEDMARLTHIIADEKGISNLTGLEHATNLERIEFRRNAISDLSPLAGLIRLNNIKLRGNKVTDVSPLAGLINVDWLGLEENAIRNLSPLKGLVKLKGIGIEGNPISDVSPLSGLLSLEGIRAWNTPISDFSPLAEARRLKWLEFRGDRSLSELSSLKNVKSLRRLVINHCGISDISGLSELTQLQSLTLHDNSISDISPLANLKGLTHLNLEYNVIKDVSPLKGLPRLKELSLNGNVISDVSPLAELVNLEKLNLSNNAISDFSPLERLSKKIVIDGSINPGTAQLLSKGGPKIEGPWLWVLVPGRTFFEIDPLAQASGGRVTESKVATDGAIEGQVVGNNVWAFHKISPTNNNLNAMLDALGVEKNNNGPKVVYGSVTLQSPRKQETKLFAGSDDHHKIWLNGEVVQEHSDWRGDNYQVFSPVTLKQGKNVLLVAINNYGDSRWNGFFGFAADAEYTISPAGTRFSLSTEATQVEVDDTFTLHLSAADITDLAGWQTDIRFDPTVLKVDSVTEGSFLTEGGGRTYFQRGTIDNTTGRIKGLSSLRISEGGVNGEGTLLSVRFTAIANGESRVSMRNFQVGSSTGETISATPPEILITVEVPEPVFPAYDVNEDGVTDAMDAQLVVTALGQKPPDNPRTDVNGDGVVDGKDLILVAEHLGEGTAPAAPSNVELPPGVTLEMVEYALDVLRAADDGSLTFQRGIENFEQLLALFIPEKTALLHNYPNPFNPETWIPYQLAEPTEVTLDIYAMNGVLVRRLALGYQPAGIYQYRSRAAYWDGKNEVGESVASGVYFYTLTAGDFTATRKMLIMK